MTKALRLRARGSRSEFWAVRHVDLEVDHGETVGVIGRNGSGKSTMLRMLAGVTAPTEGRVAVRGRVAPLISVGVGFHQELTGRENVYVSGAILGLTRKEIDGLFDQIVDFAEIEGFIDSPVKFYSSGMFVRLGFALAVAARPDVLLVDEVLAVGDFAFQAKCYARMSEMRSMGTTVLIVSHNLNAIRKQCVRTLVLHDGDPKFLGDTDAAIGVYHDLLNDEAAAAPEADTDAAAPVEVLSFAILGPDGRPTTHISTGDVVAFRLRVRFTSAVDEGAFGLQILTTGGEMAFADTNYPWGARPFRAGEEAECDVRVRMMLAGGSYIARGVVRWGGRARTQIGTGPAHFYVGGRGLVKGIADLDAAFEVAAGDDLAATEAVADPSADEVSSWSAAGGVPIFGGALGSHTESASETDRGTSALGADAPGSDLPRRPT